MSDPTDIYDVPEDQRLDTDEGEGANALDGGPDDDLADVYADPGDVWEGPQ